MSDQSPNLMTAQFLSLIRRQRGRFKAYLGYAPGVGKTYQMLEEGQRLRSLGVDVAIGAVETYGRPDVAALAGGLEQVPCRRIPVRDMVWQQMDLDAVLARRPTVVLIDELARTNAPDSRFASRYRDTEELLDAGIHVIATLDLRYLEDGPGAPAQAPGMARGRVPGHMLRTADQIVNVDLPVATLRDRFLSGQLYPGGGVSAEMQQVFALEHLTRLREVAQDKVAGLLERRGQGRHHRPRRGQDRLMVCLASREPGMSHLVRACAELAGRLSAPWYAVHIAALGTDPGQARPGVPECPPDCHALAEQLGGVPVTLTSTTLVGSIASFVAEYGITHIVLGRTQQPWYQRFFGPSVLESLLRAIRGVHVTVVDNERRAAAEEVRVSVPGGTEEPAQAVPEAEAVAVGERSADRTGPGVREGFVRA